MDKQELKKALIDVGIKEGDTILVHSNIALLGAWQGDREEILNAHFEAFMEVLGEEGTLCVPAYFYEYARNSEPYDLKLSPVSKELGIFASYVASKENATRSINPISAISAVGKNAEFINGGKSGSSYGYDTPWERLTRIDAKMIFLGIDLRSLTYLHYVEQCMTLPHLYNKVYDTPVFDNGKKIDTTIIAQVRYLDFDISYSSLKNTTEFTNAGIVKSVKVGRGKIYSTNCKDMFDYCAQKLKENPYHFLKNEPKFVKGKIPFDVI